MTEAEIAFKKMGYSKYENHPKSEIEEHTFTTQDNPYIEYKQENENAIEKIRFDLWYKRVWLDGYRKDLKTRMPCPINMEELQAINQQCKELGWLDEE